jgi:hypothetical protein
MLVLACVSVATTTAINLIWANGPFGMRNTVWGEVLRIPSSGGSSVYVQAMAGNIVSDLGPGRWFGAVTVALAVTGAMVLAIRAMPWQPIRDFRSKDANGGTQWRRILLAGTAVLLLAVVDAAAIFGYPYGNGFQPRKTPATVTISGSPSSSYTGGDVNFRVNVRNDSAYILLPHTLLTFYLSEGMHLVGPPQVTIGNGCTGSGPIVCDMGYMGPTAQGQVNFGIQFSDPGTHYLKAVLTSDGFAAPAPPQYAIGVGN